MIVCTHFYKESKRNDGMEKNIAKFLYNDDGDNNSDDERTSDKIECKATKL